MFRRATTERTSGTRGRTAALTLAVALVASACSSGATPEAAEAPAEPTVIGAAERPIGTHLVDGEGLTVYLFTEDSPGRSTCEGACLEAWPPVLTSGPPVAGGGASQALLGTLTRPDGTLQVTYSGMPLYRFRSDMGEGDTRGQTVQGVWFVVGIDGEPIGAPSRAADTMQERPGGGYGY